MKSTAQLTKENNVKSLRLNNTDREIFENYMTYIRADLSVNPHDSELMLNRILKHLIRAEAVSYTHLTLPTNREV